MLAVAVAVAIVVVVEGVAKVGFKAHVAAARDGEIKVEVVRRQGRARGAGRGRLRRAKGKIRKLKLVREPAPEMVLERVFLHVAAVLQEVVVSQNGGIRRRASKAQG